MEDWLNVWFLCRNLAAKISINFEMHKKSREKVHFFPTILIDITDFSRSSTIQPSLTIVFGLFVFLSEIFEITIQ